MKEEGKKYLKKSKKGEKEREKEEEDDEEEAKMTMTDSKTLLCRPSDSGVLADTRE